MSEKYIGMRNVTLRYEVPSSIYTYVPGSTIIKQEWREIDTGKIYTEWHHSTKSKYGRYLAGLVARKGEPVLMI